MKTFVLASIIAGLAAAAPRPQDIDFDLAYALPNPTYSEAIGATVQSVTINPSVVYSAAAAQITATDADTAGVPTATADIAHAKPYAPFASIASAASTPSGYVRQYVNQAGSSNAYGYLGFTTLQTYDVNSCAAKCNAKTGCISFNVYFERDPSVDPGSGTTGCENPASTTAIKCVFWGGPLSSADAVNTGQWRNKFQVVIAGSNGYTSTSIPSIPGYGNAIPLGNAAINAPYDSFGFNSYMGNAIFVGAFDAQLCAKACSEKSQYALAHPPTDGSPVQTCQFFNTYILYINDTKNIQGQYCAMYSESWPSSYATNVGQYRGNDHFLISYSFAYSNQTNPGSACKDCAPYCSSVLGYTPIIATATSTAFTTPLTTVITTVTSTISQSSTVTAVTTVFQKRQAAPSVETILTFSTSNGWLVKTHTTAALARRELSTPVALQKYPASVVSSACSLVVKSPTLASTTKTTTITATAPAVTYINTEYALTTTTLVQSVTSTITSKTSIAPIPSGYPCGSTLSSGDFWLSKIYCNADIVSGTNYLFTGSASSLQDCVDQCATDGPCFVTRYSPKDGTCAQYGLYGFTTSFPDVVTKVSNGYYVAVIANFDINVVDSV